MMRINRKEKRGVLRRGEAGTAVGLALLILILMMAFFPFLFTSQDPYEQDLMNALQAPSMQHLFGTDQYGRDVFTRIIYGTRVDLLIGVAAMIVPFLMGSLIGLLAGYYGGWVDALVMRIQDIVTAFPFTILIIAIITILFNILSFFFGSLSILIFRSFLCFICLFSSFFSNYIIYSIFFPL